ncbi:MAG: ATP-binding protein [Spirochaetes bacterium]|nr:ATP-binding protein [Spirochaetota bacterium]
MRKIFNFNSFIYNIITSGTYDHYPLKKRIRLILLNIIITICILVFLYLGLRNLFQSFYTDLSRMKFVTAIIEVVAVSLFSIILFYIRLKKKAFPADLFFILILTSLCCYLVVTVDAQETGLIWILPWSVITVFSLGFRMGLYLNSVFFIFLLAFLFQPVYPVSIYSEELKLRILVSFFTLASISLVFDRIMVAVLDSYHQSQKDMKRLKQQQTIFFYKLALEIKEKLSRIHDNLDDYIQEPNLTKNITFLKNNNQKLSQIILNFLNAQRQEHNIIFNHDQQFNVSTFLISKSAFYQEKANFKNITLKRDIDSDIILKADPHAFDQIVTNMIDNALKYTPEGGEINISLKTAPKKIIFSVKDNGVGISKEHLKTIFLPNFPVVAEEKEKKSKGMGLFILKNIVDSLGGEISIDSNEGKGTKIAVELMKNTMGTAYPVLNHYQATDLQISQPAYELATANISQKNIIDNSYEQLSEIINMIIQKKDEFYVLYRKDMLNSLKSIPNPEVIFSYIMLEGMSQMKLFEDESDESQMDKFPSFVKEFDDQQSSNAFVPDEETKDFVCKSFDVEDLFRKIESIIHFREAKKAMEFNKIQNQIDKIFSFDNETDKDIKTFDQICAEYNFSERELDVARCILKGLTNKEISDELFISYETVKTHVKNILKKCRISSRVEFIKLLSNYEIAKD